MNVDRRKFIGGSDAPIILGISPWRTPLQLWQDKTQPAMPENHDPERQRVLERGKRLEPYVTDILAAETGLTIAARNVRHIDPEFGFLAGEVDAETADGVNVEIKTVSPFKAAEWGEQDSDAIPVHYTAQAQHNLMVTGRLVCIFGVLIGGDDFRTYRVERDDEIITAMRAREVQFWREHVEALVPPPIASHADIARLFMRDAGTAIEASQDVVEALDQLRYLKGEADRIAGEIEQHKATVMVHMRDAARVTFNGRDLATWKTQRANRFDQRAFQAAHPELFERFVKVTESRVFRLK